MSHHRDFTAEQLPGLCDELAERDPDLQSILDDFGYPPYWSRDNSFESLVWFILEQQVSQASARAALDRLRARLGPVVAPGVLALTDAELRAASFSRQKAGYVRGLAQEIVDGHLDLAGLAQLSDARVRERLITVRGIGNWTIEVYLLLALHRRDVFPGGDLAAVKAVKRLKGLDRGMPSAQVVELATAWAPLRSIATMLLWHDYLSRRRSR